MTTPADAPPPAPPVPPAQGPLDPDALGKVAFDARHQLMAQLRSNPTIGGAQAIWAATPEMAKAGFRVMANAVARHLAKHGVASAPGGVAATNSVAAEVPTQRDKLWDELGGLAKELEHLRRRVEGLEQEALARMRGETPRLVPEAPPPASPAAPPSPNGEGG